MTKFKNFLLFIALPITTPIIWWHLFQRMLNGFDVPETDIEFWDETTKKEFWGEDHEPRSIL